MLEAVDQLQQLGPAETSTRLSESVTIQERLAATVLGLTDQPFDVRAAADAGAVPELHQRVRRLYTLLLDARAEVNGTNIRKP